jgi:PPOX class probable F420-dependent enzyme
MGVSLPAELRTMLDDRAFVVLATINPDGAPQTSVIWATYDGDQVVFSTIEGRRKTRNLQRDPRVSLCVYRRDDPYHYVEVRGAVSMTREGGPELIEKLSQHYDGEPFREGNPANVRVVCRVDATRVVVY